MRKFIAVLLSFVLMLGSLSFSIAENISNDNTIPSAEVTENTTQDQGSTSSVEIKESESVPGNGIVPEPTAVPYQLPENADRTLTITTEEKTVAIGKQVKLAIEIERLTEEAPKKSTIEWESSDETIATVNAQGNVKGIAQGTVWITASLSDNPEIKAFKLITVIQAIKSVKAETNKFTLLLEGNEKLSQDKIVMLIEPEDATVQTFSFSSSDEEIVKVDNEGNLQAVAPGKARITVVPNEEGSKLKATCDVTVGKAVQSIAMSSAETIDKRKTFNLKPGIAPEDVLIKTVEYESSNPDVATVNKGGTISAKECGTAVITCKATDGSGVSAECKVTVVQPVTKVSSKDRKIVIFRGENYSWYTPVEPADATNKKLSYTSDSNYIASISDTGYISGSHAGKTKVYATSTDGSNRSCSCEVIVEPSVPISLDSIGHGIFNYNLLGLTVTNKCSTKTIINFDFDMNFYDYSNSLVNGGSYSLGKDARIGPNQSKTIKRTVYGAGQAYKTVITITGVYFSDGSYWDIPASEEETWSFTR